jgi:hypothetical protein
VGYQMRGSKVRGRRRKYRVGARTVNFASIGLVASALVVVVEITAPSGAPPGVFESAGEAGRGDSPSLPPDTNAPAAVRVPGARVLLGGPAQTSTPALAFSVGPGLTLPRLPQSPASAQTVLATTAVPAAVQRSHASAEAAQHSPAIAAIAAIAAAGSHSNGVGKSSGNPSGNSSANAQAGVVLASTSPDPSPNVTAGGGNGNSGGDASGHAIGPSFSQAAGPAQQDPLVPSSRIGASAAPARGAGDGHGSH